MQDVNGSYICPAIHAYIQKNKRNDTISDAIVWRKRQQVGRVNVHLLIWIKPNDFPDENISIHKIGAYVFGLVQWIQTLRWSSTSLNDLSINLYLTPYKKIWCPSETRVINRCHMNSGETDFYGKQKANITIWRREDYSKVIIHELLHAFDWDRLLPISFRHNTKTKVHEAESVVEALANIFHSFILSQGDPTKNREFQLRERKHAIELASQLNSIRWTTTETHVREYCILKAALICNDVAHQKFWSWLSLPSVNQLQREWVYVRSFCENELNNMIKKEEIHKRCISLQLVSIQLSLAPELSQTSKR